MASKIQIWNLALYKLGTSVTVPVASDQSKDAQILDNLWDTCLEQVVAARNWPWLIVSRALAIPQNDPVQPGWAYRYSVPNDCVTALALTDANGLRSAPNNAIFADTDYLSGVWGIGAFDWEMSMGEQGRTINTDVAEAYLVFVVKPTATEALPALFVEALSWKIAAEMAPPKIGDVGINAQPRLLQAYEYALSNAAAHSFNESRSDSRTTPAAVRSREGW